MARKRLARYALNVDAMGSVWNEHDDAGTGKEKHAQLHRAWHAVLRPKYPARFSSCDRRPPHLARSEGGERCQHEARTRFEREAQHDAGTATSIRSRPACREDEW